MLWFLGRVVYVIIVLLFIPLWPLAWLMARLEAKPCPKCGKSRTEIISDVFGTVDWHCRTCNHYWSLPGS